MSPAASSSSFSGDASPPSSHLPLSLHLLSTTVATAAAAAVHSSSSDSDMDANNHLQRSADETSSASPSPPHPPSNSPSPPPPPPSVGKHHHPPATSAPPPPPRAIPVREDCWSEEATQTLVDAWGERYLDLKRGNLRQKHWQEVADAVNAAHAHTKRLRRTDVQCKNRIDTIKKKYKIEKARTVESLTLSRRGGGGGYVSPWPIFSKLDALIGDVAVAPGSYNNSNNNNKPIPPPPPEQVTRKPAQSAAAAAKQPLSNSPATPALVLTSPVPVGPRSFKPKRPATMDTSFYRRTFAAAAAAAAPAASSSEEDRRDSEDEEVSRSSGLGGMGNRGRRPPSVKNGGRKRTRRRCGSGDSEEGCKQLADAILRFGEIYERVETMKQEQIVELEKHRMEFSKELEFQRMKLLMDTQLQLAKIKRLKPPSNNDDVDSY